MIQQSSILLRPDGMTQKDVLKIISFVYKYMLNNESSKLINDLEFLLNRWFGFTYNHSLNNENVVDLFSTDNILSFINSKYFDKYFYWFNGSVNFNDIYNLYKDVNLIVINKLKKNYSYKNVK